MSENILPATPFVRQSYLQKTPGMQWYCCKVHSGCESRTKMDLRTWSYYLNLSDSFGEIIIPIEWVAVPNNKNKKSQKLYPGYLFVEMEMTNDTYWLVKNLPRTQEFGEKGKPPQPIPFADINHLLSFAWEGTEMENRVLFERNDEIQIILGPLVGFKGFVTSVGSQKASVRITTMGRQVETVVEFSRLKKVVDK